MFGCTVRIWLHVVGVVFLLVMASRGEMSLSERIRALSAACRQEGEMEQYLEEKKASQKRPAASLQRQERKKATFQSPQRPVASGSGQASVGSPAWTSPSSSSSSASDRTTTETSSPSSSVYVCGVINSAYFK
ncbi:hypothetical protein Taro_001903 [Colocasia esculenta]|uniref:Uncharacterized protein n=1 Tax=Colocasia esculenta TaxID=4460 RepID=A0A843TH86_COLES|nr:hypothetical protein [Colocasia esculenta]